MWYQNFRSIHSLLHGTISADFNRLSFLIGNTFSILWRRGEGWKKVTISFWQKYRIAFQWRCLLWLPFFLFQTKIDENKNLSSVAPTNMAWKALVYAA